MGRLKDQLGNIIYYVEHSDTNQTHQKLIYSKEELQSVRTNTVLRSVRKGLIKLWMWKSAEPIAVHNIATRIKNHASNQRYVRTRTLIQVATIRKTKATWLIPQLQTSTLAP